ncbi:B3 domain-containing transcription factor VRN1-like [Euphorbia lathyris]|uniref:B3 domain-containing transcription factor VRN1-like n=1 Tax=Euphorbia lathyris TaxID=212925 RepID=UPI003314342F
MASSSKKNNGCLMFKADQKPHFFKVILSNSDQHEKTAIPRRFVKKYGGYLSSPLILRVPSGQKWKIDLVKSEGDVWMQNGWKEFTDYYSVGYGYVLVFDFDRSVSEFNVTIGDRSATEIDYRCSLSSNGDKSDEQIKERSNGDKSGEQIKESSNADKSDEQITEPTIVIHDEPETEILPPKPNPDEPESEILPPKPNPDEQVQKLQPTVDPNNEAKQGRRFISKTPLTKEEKCKVVERAIANFKSDNPSFWIVMQPSYVHNTNVLPGIPLNFARQYLKDSGDAVLNNLDGKSWPIEFYSALNSGSEIMRIKNAGWREFVKGNDVNVGDVVIFELLLQSCKDDKTVFRVSIAKYSNLGKSSGDRNRSKAKDISSKQPKRLRVERLCNEKRKKIKVQNSVTNIDSPKAQVEGSKNTKRSKDNNEGSSKSVANKEKRKRGRPRINLNTGTKNPAFDVVMQPMNFMDRNKYYLRLPLNFVKGIEEGNHKVRLHADNKLWCMKLNRYPQLGIIGEGWVDFARQNSLKVGDTCTFELMDMEILLINVYISRA